MPEKSGQKVAGVGKVARRSAQEEPSFLAKDEQVRAFGRRSALRGSLPPLWQPDINQDLQVCENQQTQIDASETSCGSFDRLDDPWLG